MNNTLTSQPEQQKRKQKAIREAMAVLEKEIDIRSGDPRFFGSIAVRINFENGAPTLVRSESGITVKVS